ncbi:MAG: XRE family transcriptional regulator [Deltaproteobacteria bacterium CG07_land_8_20_14_0_80_38_7]|nr:MAG: XRE family transcriptional regulator [Deltaproteobacteria bacterium CG07_land_8_20_14_0_80_38_7]
MDKKNNIRQFREKLLMSKAELARKAGLSALTIDRIEKGMKCRMDTKRKILLALGLEIADKDQIFPEL